MGEHLQFSWGTMVYAAEQMINIPLLLILSLLLLSLSGVQTIALGENRPLDSCPLDDCPPDYCSPRTIAPEDNCPLIIASRTIAPGMIAPWKISPNYPPPSDNCPEFTNFINTVRVKLLRKEEIQEVKNKLSME